MTLTEEPEMCTSGGIPLETQKGTLVHEVKELWQTAKYLGITVLDEDSRDMQSQRINKEAPYKPDDDDDDDDDDD